MTLPTFGDRRVYVESLIVVGHEPETISRHEKILELPIQLTLEFIEDVIDCVLGIYIEVESLSPFVGSS